MIENDDELALDGEIGEIGDIASDLRDENEDLQRQLTQVRSNISQIHNQEDEAEEMKSFEYTQQQQTANLTSTTTSDNVTDSVWLLENKDWEYLNFEHLV